LLDQEHKQHETGSCGYNVAVQGRQASKSVQKTKNSRRFEFTKPSLLKEKC
jgi:hypothetical protein